MELETITDNDELLIRRMTLAPGEPMYWHTDRCRRFSVVVQGEELAIEYRDGSAGQRFPVSNGLCGWDEPEQRVHRAVNVGGVAYTEIVTFYKNHAGEDPQPRPDAIA